MKTSVRLCSMLIICIAGVTACESLAASSKSEKAMESIFAAEANIEVNKLSESEKKEYALISKYFDIEEYAEENGRIKDNQTKKALSSMIVDNTRFEIGMSYDDILLLGYKSEEESFANKEVSCLVDLGEFINDKESSVRLGFASSDSFDSNVTVSNGSCLHEIVAYPESNTFSVDEISESSTISDIIDVFDDPYRIDAGFYSDFADMEMVYKSEERSQYLTFYVNLETEKIVSVHLEGYTE